MNKENIYQIIGYNGEYNDKVKKALKKLLKENHPDQGGDARIFGLVKEVKNELDEGNVSYNYKKSKINNYEDIDYDYCSEMLVKLMHKREILNNELMNKKTTIDNLEKEYNDLYKENLKKKKDILNLEQYKKSFNKIKRKCLLLLLLLIISFIYAVIKKSTIVLIIFFVLAFTLFYEMRNFFVTLKDVKNIVEIKMKGYFKNFKNLHENNEKKSKEEKFFFEQKEELKLIENDIRFYNNLLKQR